MFEDDQKGRLSFSQVRRYQPILVTGSHRCGSTWVSKMLNLSYQTYYLGEIFNPHYGRLDPGLLRHWFQYIPAKKGSNHDFYNPLKQILTLEYSWPRRGMRRFLPRKLSILKRTLRWWGLPRPIMKDPIAVFSAEWLTKTFNMQTICLIRHPAAFVHSLIKAKWDFDFRSFTEQPKLIEDWLFPFINQLTNPPKNMVERGSLIWLCIYHVLTNYVQKHPEWTLMRLEDIALNPLAEFEFLYRRSGLIFNSRIKKSIWKYSKPSNPVNSIKGDLHVIKRNSSETQKVWRQALDPDQVSIIRHICEPVSCYYYSDADW